MKRRRQKGDSFVVALAKIAGKEVSEDRIGETRLGMAIAMGGDGDSEQSVVGRIVGLLGSENPSDPGVHSIIKISTPHGSTLETGITSVRYPNPRECERLKEYERDDIEKGTLAYDEAWTKADDLADDRAK